MLRPPNINVDDILNEYIFTTQIYFVTYRLMLHQVGIIILQCTVKPSNVSTIVNSVYFSNTDSSLLK
jgi:hypothetical protein